MRSILQCVTGITNITLTRAGVVKSAYRNHRLHLHHTYLSAPLYSQTEKKILFERDLQVMSTNDWWLIPLHSVHCCSFYLSVNDYYDQLETVRSVSVFPFCEAVSAAVLCAIWSFVHVSFTEQLLIVICWFIKKRIFFRVFIATIIIFSLIIHIFHYGFWIEYNQRKTEKRGLKIRWSFVLVWVLVRQKRHKHQPCLTPPTTTAEKEETRQVSFWMRTGNDDIILPLACQKTAFVKVQVDIIGKNTVCTGAK